MYVFRLAIITWGQRNHAMYRLVSMLRPLSGPSLILRYVSDRYLPDNRVPTADLPLQLLDVSQNIPAS